MASPQSPARLGRVGWTVLVLLVAISVVAGLRAFVVWAGAWFPALLFPPAAGLPAFVPPLRFWPLGETTTAIWLIDLVGVAVMLVTAIVWLRAASRRHPFPRRWRAFGRGVGVTVVAVVAGNIARGVAQSFILHADLGTYLGQLAANIAVSALTAALLGLIVGLVAALVGGGHPRDDVVESSDRAMDELFGR